MKAFIAKHPLKTYYALTFAISWSGFVLVVGPDGFPGNGSQFDSLVPLVVLAMLAGPSVAGILLTALVSGRAGLRELLSRLLRWKVAARWYVAALVPAPVLAAALEVCQSGRAGRRGQLRVLPEVRLLAVRDVHRHRS
jgi:hypothetical protein